MNEAELESQVRDMLDSRAAALVGEEPGCAQLRRSGLRRRRVRDGTVGASVIALIAGVFFAVHVGGTGDVASGTKPASTLPVDSDGWEAGRPAILAMLGGTLTVSVRDGVACYKLGNAPVEWPAGYRAERGTLNVLNGNGQVVATPGQRVVAFGGGSRRADTATPCHAVGDGIVEVQGLYPESPRGPSPTFPGSLTR